MTVSGPSPGPVHQMRQWLPRTAGGRLCWSGLWVRLSISGSGSVIVHLARPLLCSSVSGLAEVTQEWASGHPPVLMPTAPHLGWQGDKASQSMYDQSLEVEFERREAAPWGPHFLEVGRDKLSGGGSPCHQPQHRSLSTSAGGSSLEPTPCVSDGETEARERQDVSKVTQHVPSALASLGAAAGAQLRAPGAAHRAARSGGAGAGTLAPALLANMK